MWKRLSSRILDVVRGEDQQARLALAAVVLLLAALMSSRIHAAWVSLPDDGVVAYSAERAMRGELPHRDYDELWTGGLSLFLGAFFRIFGPSIKVVRTVLLACFLVSLPALFWCIRSYVRPLPAAAITLIGGLLMIPANTIALPSWYVLFAELWGTLAVIRYLRSGRRRWLFAAGVAGGVALLVKIVGLYFVAAVMMGIAYVVQSEGRHAAHARLVRAPGYFALIAGCGVALFAMVIGLVRSIHGPTPWIHYVVPIGALVGLLVTREWHARYPSSVFPVKLAAKRLLIFGAGIAVPVGMFVAVYAAAGAMPSLWYGVFIQPTIRLTEVTYELPGLRTSLVAIAPLLTFVVGARFVSVPLRRIDLLGLVLAVIAALTLFAVGADEVSTVAFNGLRIGVPTLGLAAAVLLWKDMPACDRSPAESFTLIAITVLCSLIQVPVAYYPYFFYFAPLGIVAAVALALRYWRVPRAIFTGAVVFLVGFAASIAGVGTVTAPARGFLPGRAGVYVGYPDSVTYARLSQLVEAHAGPWIFAWNNVAEVYFLTGRRNPTRSTYEIFERPELHSTPQVQRVIRSHDVRLVVLASAKDVRRPMNADLSAWIEREFPSRRQVGRFTVRWRESGW